MNFQCCLIKWISILNQYLKLQKQKWNFNSYKPGLVGGHCISVDPYYLTYKANQIGFKTEMIIAGRKINDNFPQYVATQLLKKIKEKNISLNSKDFNNGSNFQRKLSRYKKLKS